MDKRALDDDIAEVQRSEGWCEDRIRIYANIQNSFIEKLFPTGKEKYSVGTQEEFACTLNLFENVLRESLEEVL